jgi:hypothetical protein
MSISRRDFMKLFGIGMASILMTRCRPVFVSCYTPTMPPHLDESSTPRDRLRECWLSFGDLAQKTRELANAGSTVDTFGTQLATDHRGALDELVASGELTATVADLIHEAYMAALYHVWRSNSLVTCYAPAIEVNYAPSSANALVRQSEILGNLSEQSTIDPETLAKAQSALEHDMAFYAMSDAEMRALLEGITASQQPGQRVPAFEELQLEVTPEAKAAAEFILHLLTEK